MKNATMTAWLVLAALVPATLAMAESLEEKRWKEGHEKVFKPQVEKLNKACGTTIDSKIDWSSFKYDDWQKDQPGMKCENVMFVVENLCSQADGKAAVAKAIKSITCKASDTSKVDLKGGALDYAVTLKKNMTQDDIKKYLLKNI